eukprot:6484815-Amphidinium_carterae.1
MLASVRNGHPSTKYVSITLESSHAPALLGKIPLAQSIASGTSTSSGLVTTALSCPDSIAGWCPQPGERQKIAKVQSASNSL